jgi:hypothetical protein
MNPERLPTEIARRVVDLVNAECRQSARGIGEHLLRPVATPCYKADGRLGIVAGHDMHHRRHGAALVLLPKLKRDAKRNDRALADRSRHSQSNFHVDTAGPQPAVNVDRRHGELVKQRDRREGWGNFASGNLQALARRSRCGWPETDHHAVG